MRKINVATFVSMDGVMQAPGGPEEDPTGGFEHGGWMAPLFDEALGEAVDEVFTEPFDLLLGRKTYDIFAAHWPHFPTDPEAPGYDPGGAKIAELFDRITKYVATHRPESLDWKGSEWLGPDAPARLRALKQEDGPDLVVQGSSELIQALLAHDLIDTIRLFIAPIMLGKGKRLFGSGATPAGFKLVKSHSSSTGVLIAAYERAGEVGTGTFELEEPSEAEIERRKALS